MPSKLTASKFYRDLIVSIKSTLKSGFLAAQKALDYQRLKTYWEIGRQIKLAVASSQGALTFGEKLYQDINRDIEAQMGLALTTDTIGRMVQLHDEYPQFPKNTTLTYTHYLALLRIADPKERRRLEQKAIKEDWSSPDLKTAVAKINAAFIPPKKIAGKLIVERGEPYVYRTHQYAPLNGEKEFCIDAGFKIDVPLKGMIVQSAVTSAIEKGRGVRVYKKDGRYDVRIHKAALEKLYTYAATVENVVDGDTLDVRIDVGFSIKLNDRLRLRGINAPEINTQEGKAAKQFLTGYLSQCPFIIVRTYKQKEEMYGRWLTDIFVIKGCADPYRIAAEGEYLNQLLLDKGFAEMY
ncbi:MAG: DUF1016 N-terminal domain-containing protein [Candidatus Omnitrophota bacterium]|nr:DUF1016 N-terminal domain-containing protein [Candidatus Omnitrophota bacterium]